MSNNLERLPTEQRRAMMQQCWQTINTNFDRLNEAPEMQIGIERLLSSEDIVTEFNTIAAESPELANMILQASVAALASNLSAQGIDAAIIPRASEGN